LTEDGTTPSRIAGEGAERARGADQHLRPEAKDVVEHLAERLRDPLTQPRPVLLRRGIRADVLGGQSSDAEMKARCVGQAKAVANRELETSAPEVGAERGARIDQDARPHGFEDQLRLSDPTDDLDRDAGRRFDALDRNRSVGRLAQRRGTHGDDLVDLLHVGHRLESPDRVDRRFDRRFGQPAFACDHVPQPQHLLLPHQRYEAAVGPGLDHQ
jgi:hypothetical protein